MTENMIKWEIGEDRVLVLTMDDPTQSVNTANELFGTSLLATVERLEAEKDSFDGVIITSAKDTFFAGGDLQMLMDAGPGDEQRIADMLDFTKDCVRRIETLGKPVVAAINGTALGGGFEIALATHHRVLLDGKGTVVGLPEVSLGLLPGAGGATRITRMIGVVPGFMNVIGQGQRHKPASAKSIGIVDEVVSTREEMFAAARAFIAANPDAAQPWDREGFRIPGGTPAVASFAANLPAIPANIRKKLKGAPMPAPLNALAAMVEGSQVDFATASKIETAYCTDLIVGKVSGNMVKALFFDLAALNKGAARPEGYEYRKPKRVLVLGAGMMGAGIAYVQAMAGMDVVLKDVSIEAAERGKNYSQKLLDKAVAKGKITDAKRDEVLARIHPTVDAADAKGCDFVVEAVFESPELKKQVFAEIVDFVDEDALLGSNTSTLPITDLATGVEREEDFIGLHFFSPVDKMPLVEIVVGAKTSEATIARAIDYTLSIKKTPIVVNDSRGFFTSRVIQQFADQALSMVAEGVHPASIEQACLQAGYPVGALALADEINMRLQQKIQNSLRDNLLAEGKRWIESKAFPLVDDMVDVHQRPGRREKRGFYDYAEDGTKLGLWPGIVDLYTKDDHGVPFIDIQERMLFAESIDTVRCFDEGVLRSVAEANIGSILGIGFPAWTGGVVQYINQYEGGLAGFVARADELRARYGDRFEVPESLRHKAQAGETLS
ncbi:3-hydroxyacyl-CoA dehydrogenase NAD-binding domain-containing protein [Nocardia nova]|uniref:3-hydroxyacyl-CoA dehydrogenase NAD-binding domain-containing protein n=1 Tax=Nocardia nova TaxID=37330 RepID=UPI001894F264|nr:3-hydroxyacyl-CoA dehydrogenase NAD-binding domain-containing protein [Nocardia nova]MBF6150051.1 enoyl-CoA hydratase/isomerase family protein [Nocardia nova]